LLTSTTTRRGSARRSLTFRLVDLVTQRGSATFQDLHYTYDPVSNITHVRDAAQQTIFFSNKRVEPSADYTYDALYRLIEATGREHLGQVGATALPASYNDTPRVGVPFSSSDGTAMARYLERYLYDLAGNFETMTHVGTDPARPGWSRAYTYAEASQLQPAKSSNRLTRTATDPLRPETFSVAGDGYDAHGNMQRMAQLQEMRWDFNDHLRMTRRQAVDASDAEGGTHQGERTFYVYDAGGQRARKVTERSPGVIKEERLYLGGLEVFRRLGTNAVVRETLHIMDGEQRIALVETRTAGNESGVPRQLIRFQFGNHLGSASLELDDQARIVSYEEYTPYGSTSYQAVRSQTDTPKRYRFTGKERDEESGLYYHGARYYAAWIGRWTSCDRVFLSPTELPGEPCAGGYTYTRNRPVTLRDPDGHLDDEAIAILNYLQDFTDQIPEREFPGLKPNVQGTRAHLALESELTTGRAPANVNIQRIAAEVQVDELGIIRGVSTTPGAAKTDWRTFDAAVLKKDVFHVQGKGFSNLIGQKASDVIEVALDYKTGKAAMKNVPALEQLIGAPYLKLATRAAGGNIVESALQRLPSTALAAGAANNSLTNATAPKPPAAPSVVPKPPAKPGQAGFVDAALARAATKTLVKGAEAALVIAPLAIQSTPEDTHVEAITTVLGLGALRLAAAFPVYTAGLVATAAGVYGSAAAGENFNREINQAARNADPAQQGAYQPAKPTRLIDMFHF
jgi:RHS repeat-associated protein